MTDRHSLGMVQKLSAPRAEATPRRQQESQSHQKKLSASPEAGQCKLNPQWSTISITSDGLKLQMPPYAQCWRTFITAAFSTGNGKDLNKPCERAGLSTGARSHNMKPPLSRAQLHLVQEYEDSVEGWPGLQNTCWVRATCFCPTEKQQKSSAKDVPKCKGCKDKMSG